MSIFSGKNGQATRDGEAIANVVGWQFTTEVDGVSFASSATGGFRKRIPGARRGSGSFSFQLNRDAPISDQLDEGDETTLRLYLDGERHFVVPAMIDSIALEVDVATGKVVGGKAEFSTSGAWEKPAS